MMKDSAYVAKEIITLLDKFEPSFSEKIPENFINILKESAKKCNQTITIDISKKLTEQDLSEECKDFISSFYYYFFAETEEKRELIKKWIDNDPDF